MRRSVKRQPRVLCCDPVEGDFEKIADEVIAGLAVKREAAQHLAADELLVCHVSTLTG